MRILLDHNVPMPLRKLLIGHQVETAYIRGWSQLVNGALIAAAENDGFDLVITTGKGIRYQQNLSGRKIALLAPTTTDWAAIRGNTDAINSMINKIEGPCFLEMELPPG